MKGSAMILIKGGDSASLWTPYAKEWDSTRIYEKIQQKLQQMFQSYKTTIKIHYILLKLSIPDLRVTHFW